MVGCDVEMRCLGLSLYSSMIVILDKLCESEDGTGGDEGAISRRVNDHAPGKRIPKII